VVFRAGTGGLQGRTPTGRHTTRDLHVVLGKLIGWLRRVHRLLLSVPRRVAAMATGFDVQEVRLVEALYSKAGGGLKRARPQASAGSRNSYGETSPSCWSNEEG
jgi:hypothetical protein